MLRKRKSDRNVVQCFLTQWYPKVDNRQDTGMVRVSRRIIVDILSWRPMDGITDDSAYAHGINFKPGE